MFIVLLAEQQEETLPGEINMSVRHMLQIVVEPHRHPRVWLLTLTTQVGVVLLNHNFLYLLSEPKLISV